MSLRIIYGRAGTGKSEFCLNEIKKNQNQKIYIITPEQFSYSMERRLLENSKNKVSLQAEVISFRRLANRIFTEVGGANDTILSKSGQAMIIYSILQQEKDNLKFLGKTKENIDLIIKELTELKKHNITTKKIEENMYQIGDINLQGKLQDIHKIYELYENRIENQYIDEDDILSKLSKKIPQSKMFDKAIVYIDEFAGFTMQEYSILREILQKAEQVNVTVCTDNLETDTLPETDIYFYNKLFINKVIKIAKEQNIEIEKEVQLTEKYRLKKEDLQHLEQNLYHLEPVKYSQKPENIEIKLTKNEYSEMENIGTKILTLVREKNWKYRDIAIITKDVSQNSNIVKAVFEKYNIPVFIDEKAEITENIVIKYILSILEMFANNWSQEAVLNYIKSGFLDLKKEEIYQVENYCIKMGIKGNKWYKNKWKDMENIQEKIMVPILKFKDNFQKEKTAKEISEKLYIFIEENKIQEKMNQKIEDLKEKNELEKAREYKESLAVLVNVLDEIVSFFGDEKISFEKYKEILKIGLKNKEIGKIPQFMDQVIIGDIDRTRTHKVKAIFITGMNDGNFPSVNKNEGYFNDNDREILKQNNLEIAKNTLENLYEDQFNIYKAFTIAEEKIYISYLSSNKEGTSLRPSILINKIKKIFPKLEEKSDVLERKIEIANVNATYENLIQKIRELAEGKEIEDIWYEIYTWYNTDEKWKEKMQRNLRALQYKNEAEKIDKEKIKEIYGKTIKTSVSKMEQYRKCPFSFHLKYGLNLKEIEEYKIKSMDTGSFMHEVIDEFFENVVNFKELEEKEIEKIVGEILEEKLHLDKNNIFTSSPKFIVLTRKLKNTIIQSIKYIVYQMKNSDFQILGNEVEFNKKMENLEIVGKVDRIDMAKDKYIRIIDFKSSEKNINFNEMMAGIQIQLITYMDILSKQTEKEPVGVLYFNLIEPIINESRNLSEEEIEEKIRKSFKMKGLILADVNIIKMMDKNLEKGSSDSIPVYLNKEGNISESKSSVITKEQFENLQKAIQKIIKDITKEILNGKIEIKPVYDIKNKKSVCEYCEYKNICRFDPNQNEYSYVGTKSKEEILEEIKERIN